MWSVLLVMAARGGVFEERTALEPWPERAIQRELVLPKGWFQVAVTADSKTTGRFRDAVGQAIRYDDGVRWSYTRAWLRIDQGFSRRIRIYLHVPWVRARLRTADAGALTTTALGDVHTGVVFQPWVGVVEGQTVARRVWATALQLDLKAPSGVEWPGTGAGGPADLTSFLTGTGITNLTARLHGQLRAGDTLLARLGVSYTLKPPGVVGYVVQDDGFGNGKLDPGDELRVDLSATVQLADPVSVVVDGRLSRRGWYRIGVSGEGLDVAAWDWLLEPSLFVDAGVAVRVEPGPHGEVVAGASYQLVGTDTTLFAPLGLEEFAPQPGLTAEVRGALRW